MTSLLTVLVALVVAPATTSAGWPQWGGPDRNFVTRSSGLAATWPADGPRRIWQRTLGDGFSAIVSDGRTLYTLYRDGHDDVAIAIDAATGKTVWESRYAAPFHETCSEQLGAAPRAAPLIAGDRLITVSAGGLMQSFDRLTGKAAWSRDLLAGATDAVRACGYSSSPLAFEDTIITTAGGKGRGVVALNARSGEPVWKVRISRTVSVAAADRSRWTTRARSSSHQEKWRARIRGTGRSNGAGRTPRTWA